MPRHGTDPHKTDTFWIQQTAEKMASLFITPAYRKRLETIYFEAKQRIDKQGITSLHFPRKNQ